MHTYNIYVLYSTIYCSTVVVVASHHILPGVCFWGFCFVQEESDTCRGKCTGGPRVVRPGRGSKSVARGPLSPTNAVAGLQTHFESSITQQQFYRSRSPIIDVCGGECKTFRVLTQQHPIHHIRSGKSPGRTRRFSRKSGVSCATAVYTGRQKEYTIAHWEKNPTPSPVRAYACFKKKNAAEALTPIPRSQAPKGMISINDDMNGLIQRLGRVSANAASSSRKYGLSKKERERTLAAH